MSVREDYPFVKERDDFLFIREFRGTMGYACLAGGVIAFAGFFGAFLLTLFYGDREVKGVGLAFFSVLILIAFLYTRKSYEYWKAGMYFYTYVGRDEIIWGDMFQHTTVNVADLSEVWVRMTKGEQAMGLKLKNGKKYTIGENHLGEMEDLLQSLQRIENIKLSDYQ